MGLPCRELYATNVGDESNEILLSAYKPIKKNDGYHMPPNTPIGFDMWIPNVLDLKEEDGDMFHLDDTWVWKPPIPEHRYIMSIDCSRGDSDDRSALEIFDLDGTDENGLPCIEQVLEYNGKITGDDLGECKSVKEFKEKYGKYKISVWHNNC